MTLIPRTLLLVALLTVSSTYGAESATGPVVEAYGPVYEVPEGSFNLDTNGRHKIVMDVGKGPEDLSARNRSIESAARFLNMHARNGIKPENMELAVVLHGSAARAALTDSAHNERFETPNANKTMLEALSEAGVDIYICGQTAAHYGYVGDQLLPEVTVAVSAMTVHVRLQQEGYQAILF